eukprot:g5276.t1
MTADDRNEISKIRTGFRKFDAQLDQLMAQPPSQSRDDSIRRLEENVLSNRVLVAANEFLDRKEQELEDSSKRNQITSQRIELGLLLLGSCGGIAGLLAGFGIARGFQKKVLQLTLPIQDAAGRLSEVGGPVSISSATGLEDLEGMLQDLSGRVSEVVQRLQESDREVIRADQLAALGQLSAGLAHELRNPLMCMKVLVQDARQKGSRGLEPQDLEVLDEEIRRLEHLVGGFMDFARPPTIIAELFDLKEVLTQTVAFLSPRAARGLNEISCRLPDGPLVVAADRAMIRQVVLNLILNSLDAVAGNGRVEVHAEFVRPVSSNGTAEGRPHVLVHVLDSGPGLPAGREQRIFDPFFSTKETGLGLGLATCRRIVELHGGEVVARNRPEGGAIVTYLLKPVELDRLKYVVSRALAISRMSHVRTLFGDEQAMQAETADMIVGRSEIMQQVYKSIGRVAPQNVTVLIQGESGTGKELIARALYHHSRRKEGPFLAINCAAIPDALLESELFGHEKGAFTGADSRRVGKFEQVNGGTLFLDEIGDMSPATQAKVLRLLQDGSFERVGGNETIHSDVRIIAATHRDIGAMVASEEFRQDLYYRLQVFSIRVPALRERMEDIPLLIQHFVKTYNMEFNKHVRSVSDEALQVLRAHPWPGNVRELQSAIKYAMVHAVGETITLDCLPPSCRTAADPATGAPGIVDDEELFDLQQVLRKQLLGGDADIYRKVHSEVDRVLLQQVLNHFDGNQAQAAQILGISRSTLRARITDLGLIFEKRVTPENGTDAAN